MIMRDMLKDLELLQLLYGVKCRVDNCANKIKLKCQIKLAKSHLQNSASPNA